MMREVIPVRYETGDIIITNDLFIIGTLNSKIVRPANAHIRCIRVIGFWRPKLDYICIPSSNAPKCTRKARFINHVPSAASESEFDRANRNPCLKVGVLVYTALYSKVI